MAAKKNSGASSAQSNTRANTFSIIAILIALFSAIVYFMEQNLQSFYVFDTKQLHDLSQRAIANHGNDTRAVVAQIVGELSQGPAGEYVNLNEEWVFNNAGGAMGAMYIIHASITEYLIIFGESLCNCLAKITKRLIDRQALPLELKDTLVATPQTTISTFSRVLKPPTHLLLATTSQKSIPRAAYIICAAARSSSTRWTTLALLSSTLVVGSLLCLVSVSPMASPALSTSPLCGTLPGLLVERCCQTWPRESFRCRERYRFSKLGSIFFLDNTSRRPCLNPMTRSVCEPGHCVSQV